MYVRMERHNDRTNSRSRRHRQGTIRGCRRRTWIECGEGWRGLMTARDDTKESLWSLTALNIRIVGLSQRGGNLIRVCPARKSCIFSVPLQDRERMSNAIEGIVSRLSHRMHGISSRELRSVRRRDRVFKITVISNAMLPCSHITRTRITDGSIHRI